MHTYIMVRENCLYEVHTRSLTQSQECMRGLSSIALHLGGGAMRSPPPRGSRGRWVGIYLIILYTLPYSFIHCPPPISPNPREKMDSTQPPPSPPSLTVSSMFASRWRYYIIFKLAVFLNVSNLAGDPPVHYFFIKVLLFDMKFLQPAPIYS